jgi:hypothetical protein
MRDITNELPPVIADYIAAHNQPDPIAFLDTFAPDALLNDAQREFLGHDDIRSWADKEVFGDNLKIEPRRAWEHSGGIVLHAKYEGDFDKTNLPDPLILTNYFCITQGKITQLIIVFNKTIWEPQKV